MTFTYYGPSMEEEKEPVPYDHHCPSIPGGLNMHKCSCLERMADPTQPDCYMECIHERKKTRPTAEKRDHKGKRYNTTFNSVVALAKSGMKRQEIADTLGLTLETIKSHINTARRKGLLS